MLTRDEAKSNVSANLSRLRKQRGLTQVQLSAASGVNQGTISTAERAEVLPDPVALANLAEALDTSVDILLRPAPYQTAVSA